MKDDTERRIAEQEATDAYVAQLETERDALRVEVERLNKQIDVRRKMETRSRELRREQYRQAYDNYVMLAQALGRVAPDVLAELRPRLFGDTSEEDKLMSRAAKAEQERDALRAELADLRQQHDYSTNAARAVLDMWMDVGFWGFVFGCAGHVNGGKELRLAVDRGEWAEKMNFLYINAYPQLFEAEDASEVE